MKRKVTKAGPASLIISLPSKWAKKNKINAGDEIEVKENKDTLIISLKETKSEKKSISVDLSNIPILLLKRHIISLYKLGYGQITIKFSNQYLPKYKKSDDVKTLDAIQSIINNLIGFEIISQKESICQIKELASPNDEEPSTILRRIFLLLLEMSKEVTTYLKNNKTENSTNIDFQHKMTYRFLNFFIRLKNKQENSSQETVLLVKELGRIADVFEFISREKFEASENFYNILDEVCLSLESLYKFYFGNDGIYLRKLIESRRKFFSHLESYEIKNKKEYSTINDLKIIILSILDCLEYKIALTYASKLE